MAIKEFKDFIKHEANSKALKEINEKVEVSSDEVGIMGYGDIVNVKITRGNNDIMQVNISGDKYLLKIKSLSKIQGDYNEDDWNTLEKIYRKITAKASKDIEKAITLFEKSLNDAFKTMEKETNKL